MKTPLLVLALALSATISLVACLPGQCEQGAPGGISMSVYPIEKGNDGIQRLVTRTGARVVVPGLGIAPNATCISVYRDQSNHFWYTNISGQQVAVTPQQLDFVMQQINTQSGGAPQPQRAQLPPQNSYYNSNPSYSTGFNGVPYGTPINMESAGQYSYMAPGGNKQYVQPTPQTSAQFNQWQQQQPYSGPPPAMNGSAQVSQHSGSAGGPMSNMRERRINRLDSRAQRDSNNAASYKQQADSNMDSGRVIGSGVRARESARQERRSNRAERRADRLDNRQQNLGNQ